MGFRNDQWYGLTRAGEPDLSGALANSAGYYLEGESTNKPFIYPDRTVRGLGAGPANNVMGTSVLKRGYIRNMAMTDLSSTETIRCQFQFNPATISQAISQPSGVLNFLQQPIEQLAQPLMGMTSFAFQLFFDRSMELNSSDSFTIDQSIEDNVDVWRKYGPETVGVLHDLARLYSIIGVGMSEDLVDYSREVYLKQADAQYNELDDAEKAEAMSSEDIGAEFDKRKNVNIGNSAFLMPLPVRVVFSAMYIVEGLVDSVSVDFTKFNSAMIPMQAAVTLTVKAVYIGFARKETYFTESLKALAEAVRVAPTVPGSGIDTVTNDPNAVSALTEQIAAAKQTFSSIGLQLVGSGGATQRKFVEREGLEEFVTRFPESKGADTIEEATIKAWFPIANPESSPLYNQMQAGTSLSIEKAYIRIYRVVPSKFGALLSVNSTFGGQEAEIRAKLVDTYDSDPVSVGQAGGTVISVQDVKDSIEFPDREDGRVADVYLIREGILTAETLGEKADAGEPRLDASDGTSYIELCGGEDGFRAFDSKTPCYSARQTGNPTEVLISGESQISEDNGIGWIWEDSFESEDGRDKIAFVVDYYVKVVLAKDGNQAFAEGNKIVVCDTWDKFKNYFVSETIPIVWPDEQESDTSTQPVTTRVTRLSFENGNKIVEIVEISPTGEETVLSVTVTPVDQISPRGPDVP